MKKEKQSSELIQLLKLIDESYNKKSWHGTNLMGSIRRLTASQAAWRPAANRHNIWEIVLHAAYWKYAVRRRLLGEKRGSFPIKGSNWFIRPEQISDKSWREDIKLLDEMHESMRETIKNLKTKDLEKIPLGSKVNNLSIITGIALHDVYHAGQIQLLKRLRNRLMD